LSFSFFPLFFFFLNSAVDFPILAEDEIGIVNLYVSITRSQNYYIGGCIAQLLADERLNIRTRELDGFDPDISQSHHHPI
jgi:hypothetical protein